MGSEVISGIEHPPKNGIPSTFALMQNYPNPFNPTTKIAFTLSQKGTVRLTVYDVLGREVARIVDETLPAGYYEEKFDASRFSSGVYYYRITCGKWSETKKMVLLH